MYQFILRVGRKKNEKKNYSIESLHPKGQRNNLYTVTVRKILFSAQMNRIKNYVMDKQHEKLCL